MQRHPHILGIAWVCSILVPVAAYAIPLYNVTGETPEFAVDQALPTASPIANQVAGKPSAITSVTPNRKVTVQDGYTDAGTGAKLGTGKVLVMSCTDDSSAGPVIYFMGNAKDISETGFVVIKWDMLIDSQAISAGSLQIQTVMNAKDNRSRIIINLGNNFISMDMSQNPGSAVSAPKLKAEKGRELSFELTIDQTARTQTLRIDKHDDQGLQLFGTTTTGDDPAVRGLMILPSNKAFRGTCVFDNIQIMPKLTFSDEPAAGGDVKP